jgi:hypothetical protein
MKTPPFFAVILKPASTPFQGCVVIRIRPFTCFAMDSIGVGPAGIICPAAELSRNLIAMIPIYHRRMGMLSPLGKTSVKKM